MPLESGDSHLAEELTVSTHLIEEARRRAEEVLLANQSPLGLMAGGGGAYPQVWARDSMICGLGLLLVPGGATVHRRSLETLARFQSELGRIPHHVGDPDVPDASIVRRSFLPSAPAIPSTSGQEERTRPEQRGQPVEDTGHAGCVDSSLWFLLGHYVHFRATGDTAFLEVSWPALDRALLWLRYQDSNECGLLEVHEAMDWADLFANRYNVLYDNVLWYATWRAMEHLARALGRDTGPYSGKAEDVRRKINMLLWVGPESPADLAWAERNRREWVYPMCLAQITLGARPFYLPYVAFRDFADRCDALGNSLAVLLGVASDEQATRILDYFRQQGMADPYPLRALDRPVLPGDRDWREYYRSRNLNLPDHYHNGGIWPFVGGFYVAALVAAGRQAEAERELEKLARANRQGLRGEWEFNEWLHGRTGQPMGFPRQSWSAAMYIYAYDAVSRGRPAWFWDSR